MPEATPEYRRRPRRWGRIILVLAVLAVGYGGYCWLLLPHMWLVTVRLLPSNAFIHFSARGPGYPAIQETGPPDMRTGDALWLSDDCRPLEGSFLYDSVFNPVGLQRDVVCGQYLSESSPDYQAYCEFIAWRDGRRCILDGRILPPEVPTLGFSSDEPRAFPRWYFAGDDPGYTPFWHPSDCLAVYDRKARRTIFTCRLDYREESGVVFHHGSHFIIVPRSGRAFLYTDGKQTHTFGTKKTAWCWGEESTVWTVNSGAVQLLHWRVASPRLIRLPIHAVSDPRIVYLGNRPNTSGYGGNSEPPPPPNTWNPDPSVVLWNDGRLSARTETVRRWPRQIEPLIRKFAPGVPWETRRLTLYRHGRRIGRYHYQIDPKLQNWTITWFNRTGAARTQRFLVREHLAFTGDGNYLSWTVATRQGTKIHAYRLLPPLVRLTRFP